MISATLDSSVYVRAFNFGGPAAKLLAYARAREIRIDISKAILDETIGVLREKFKRDPYTLNDIRQKLTATCNFIASTGTLDVVKEDRMVTVFWNAQKQRIRATLSRKIKIYSVWGSM